jgi:hypothetical protein
LIRSNGPVGMVSVYIAFEYKIYQEEKILTSLWKPIPSSTAACSKYVNVNVRAWTLLSDSAIDVIY